MNLLYEFKRSKRCTYVGAAAAMPEAAKFIGNVDT
jgi:hypothetical protein